MFGPRELLIRVGQHFFPLRNPPRSPRNRKQHREQQLFADQGYASTRVVDIVDAAGVAKGLFYWYFENKEAVFCELADSIRRIAEGGSVLDPEVVAQLVERRRTGDSPIDQLTEREREVLALMAEGRSNQAIGEQLFLSPKTIETHIRQIFQKLGLTESAESHRRVLAVLAYLNGRPPG